jgi:UDP-N-acetylmuramyl pentapeptide phosphotransferase/UDP-N-acetylglucosamine-1-phosphate transferase
VTPRRLAVAAFAATVAWQARRLLVAAPPAGQQRWRRTNFRGRSVDILGGPAAVTAVLAGLVRGESHPLAPAVATVGAGLLGLYDDLTGTTHARGLHGHLAATGAVTSLSGRRPMPAIPLDTVLVAGTANLVNLLDLRPGRALKVSLAVAAVLLAGDDSSGVGPSCLGAAVALLPGDLREEHMLGDCGANALGAALGWGLATRSPVPRRLAAAVVVALNLVSEKVSFSRVIDEHPLLAAVDRWGRMAT